MTERAALPGAAPVYVPTGRITGAVGTVIRAEMPHAAIGELCRLPLPDGGRLEAEVIGFDAGAVLLAPLGDLRGLPMDAEIVGTGRARRIEVGPGLRGRVVGADARPLDGRGPVAGPLVAAPLAGPPPDAMLRPVIREPFPVGVRAIDGLLTCARGQRVGLFGAAGGGKSTLLAQLVRGAPCEICVVALVGERGREVREFVEDVLGAEALARSVVVVATSDRPAVERAGAAHAATRIAEAFRDEGADVLLVIDSLTRFARAQREIGLSAGELPTRRGFPNSVFTALPGLLERAGLGATGAITAFYTVLVEGEADADPVAEEARSILDGHVVLSPALAARGHYPAIDVLASKSRLMPAVTGEAHRADAASLQAMMASAAEVEFLVQVGEYRAGSDALADRALARRAAIDAFLRQPPGPPDPYEATLAALAEIAR